MSMSKDFASSNPFRKAVSTGSPKSASQGGTSTSDEANRVSNDQSVAQQPDATVIHQRAQSVSKAVRIISPPPELSVSDLHTRERVPTPIPLQINSELDSLSPSSSSSSDDSPIDPFESSGEHKRILKNTELKRNTLRNQSINDTDSRESHGASPNPSHKTLETLDTGGSTSTNSDKTLTPQSKPVEAIKSTPARGSMDVDAFKRMLLTGSPSVLPPKITAASPHTSGVLGDSSSGTDTSSISRQSIFEPTLETQPDSPRTSHEINISDDENHGRSGDVHKERRKPPPPRTRHGKPLQTISQQSPLSSAVNKKGSEVNSPSPPIQSSTATASEYSAPPLSRSNSELQTSQDNPPSRSSSGRKAPAPPLSRRHSQLTRPTSSSEGRSEPRKESRTINLDGPNEDSAVKNPPPPPPTRRTGQSNRHSMIMAGSTSNPSTPSSSVEIVNDPIDMSRSSSNISIPPPPPARSSSISSTKRPTKIVQQSTTPSPSSTFVVPPIPPPRRRASSRSSVEVYARSETNRRSSGSLLEESTEDIDAKPSKDVLADISALQREVDELRGKFESGPKS